MPKFLSGLSHKVVKTVRDKESMTKLKETIAMVSLCFASDEDAIWVFIRKMDGPTAGVTAELPHFTIGDSPLPAIRGKLANEIKLEALLAFDKVKQQFGVKFNKRYRVTEKAVEEINA